MAGSATLDRDWNTVPLNELIRHIVGTHHDYLKNELPRLSERVAKVARVYAEREPHVEVGTARQHEPVRRPVDHLATADPARTEHQVVETTHRFG